MQPPLSQLPDTIGRFKVESLLGRGGMGEVYKAIDPTLQRTVAVKTVRPDIDRPEYLERLYREAQACARLHHPNIVTVFEAGEINGLVYIAMEYLQGENLSEKLARGGMTFEDKIGTLLQILSALDHAHAQNVVHRDIKPSNIYVQSDGVIKLVDFGLARVVAANTLTISGTIVGTPHYASPEQLRGEPIDGRTDVYSTGALAYEMLSGRLPFRGDDDSSITAVILRVISQPAPAMDTAMSRMLPDIERIVSRAMAKPREDRYQSAKEMRSDLVSFLTSSTDAIRKLDSQADQTFVLPDAVGATTLTTPDKPVADKPVSRFNAQPLPSPPVPWWWWAGGAAAAIAVVAGYLSLRSPGPVPDPGPDVGTIPAAAGVTSPAPSTPSNPAPADAKPEPSVAKAAPPATPVMPAAKPADATAAPASTSMRDVDAKEMFAGSKTGLRYRLQQKASDGAVFDVDATTRFRTGDQVRFSFESNTDGYLYVIQQGSSGAWTVLFPNTEINGGRNKISRGEEYLVPNEDWFGIEGPAGADQVYVIFSRDPLAQLPGFNRPVTKTETLTASEVSSVQSTIKSRDLVFKKDTSGAGKKSVNVNYVVNPTEVSKAVSASFTLSHDQ